MKNLLALIFILCCISINAQIITEIMYNPPEDGVDSLEYIEIYNNTNADIDFSGFSMIGINYTFDSIPALGPEEYLVVCKDSLALSNNFGTTGYQWDTGALSNNGEALGITNAIGDTVFLMTYGTIDSWPNANLISGSSIELCDSDSDPNVATSWNLSQSFTDVIINNALLIGSPGSPNQAVCQIQDYKDIAISEVMYESPSWDPELQYIELYNYGNETINLANWSIVGDINLPGLNNVQLAPDSYYLIGNNPIGLIDFGLTMVGWGSTNKISLDPNLILLNPAGEEVVSLLIDEDRDFPNPEAGQALELCDPLMDNNTSLNWSIATNQISMNGNTLFGTPVMDNTCTMIGTSSVSNGAIDYNISIYPNPSHSEINISSSERVDKIQIYDQLGRMIKEANKQQTITVDDLLTGRYFVKVYLQDGITTQAFVKM